MSSLRNLLPFICLILISCSGNNKAGIKDNNKNENEPPPKTVPSDSSTSGVIATTLQIIDTHRILDLALNQNSQLTSPKCARIKTKKQGDTTTKKVTSTNVRCGNKLNFYERSETITIKETKTGEGQNKKTHYDISFNGAHVFNTENSMDKALGTSIEYNGTLKPVNEHYELAVEWEWKSLPAIEKTRAQYYATGDSTLNAIVLISKNNQDILFKEVIGDSYLKKDRLNHSRPSYNYAFTKSEQIQISACGHIGGKLNSSSETIAKKNLELVAEFTKNELFFNGGSPFKFDSMDSNGCSKDSKTVINNWNKLIKEI